MTRDGCCSDLINRGKSRKSVGLGPRYAVGSVNRILLAYYLKNRACVDKVGSFLVY